MKIRWTVPAAALGVFLVLSGCGNGETEKQTAAAQEETVKPEENEKDETLPKPFRAAICSDTGDERGRQIRDTLEEVMKTLDIEYLSYDCAGDRSLQDQQMAEAISEGAEILFTDRVESEDGTESEKLSVPTVFLDVTERPWEEGKTVLENCVVLALRETDTGRMLGQMAGKWLLENFERADENGDGSIAYGLYLDDMANPANLFRAQYSIEEADKILVGDGKPQLLYFDPKGPDQFQTGTGISEKMEVIFCSDEKMVRELADELPKEIPIFTVGDSEETFDLLEEGVLTGTVLVDQEVLAEAVEILAANARDKEDLRKGMEVFPMGEEGRYYIPFTTMVKNS